MSEEVFTLRFERGVVFMPIADFFKLLEELGQRGVDVEITGQGPESLSFRFTDKVDA